MTETGRNLAPVYPEWVKTRPRTSETGLAEPWIILPNDPSACDDILDATLTCLEIDATTRKYISCQEIFPAFGWQEPAAASEIADAREHARDELHADGMAALRRAWLLPARRNATDR